MEKHGKGEISANCVLTKLFLAGRSVSRGVDEDVDDDDDAAKEEV